MIRDAEARNAKLNQIENQLSQAYNSLAEAQSLREQGPEVGLGDKNGRRLPNM